MADDINFNGTKLALFIGAQLLVIRRDRNEGIPWPGYLDWPGGGREGGESPEACTLRETFEEVGLRLGPRDLVWRNALDRPVGRIWFFAAHLPAGAEAEVVFGNEGLGWWLMPPQDYLVRADAIPHFRDQLALYLSRRAAG